MITAIGFENHRVSCIIGCLEEERKHEKEVLIDLTVGVQVDAAINDDDIHKAISYVDLANLCTDMAKKHQYHLLETMATSLTEQLLKRFPLHWVHIKIKKPSALPSADFAFVELRRNRT